MYYNNYIVKKINKRKGEDRVSYVNIGDKIYDSQEILGKIKEEFGFKEVKDLTGGSKRDDTLVYKIILDAEVLKNEIEVDLDIEGIEDDEMVEELMTSSDEHVMLIEDIIPEEFIGYAYTYKYDSDMKEVKSIFVAIDETKGESKLKEITERILKSVD